MCVASGGQGDSFRENRPRGPPTKAFKKFSPVRFFKFFITKKEFPHNRQGNDKANKLPDPVFFNFQLSPEGK
jgi:hypothetical protein